jgi:hypothetical protein
VPKKNAASTHQGRAAFIRVYHSPGPEPLSINYRWKGGGGKEESVDERQKNQASTLSCAFEPKRAFRIRTIASNTRSSSLS